MGGGGEGLCSQIISQNGIEAVVVTVEGTEEVGIEVEDGPRFDEISFTCN